MKPENAPHLDAWMNPTEVAATLGITRQTVNQMIHAGEFKTLHRTGVSTQKPQFAVKRTEVEKIAETRTFPRSKQIPEISSEDA